MQVAEASPARVATSVASHAGVPASVPVHEDGSNRYFTMISSLASADYEHYGRGKAQTWPGKLVWFGQRIFSGAQVLGEVFADFFGFRNSRYQYVVDAYERHLEQTMEEEREEARARHSREQIEVKQELESFQLQQRHQQQPSHVLVEQIPSVTLPKVPYAEAPPLDPIHDSQQNSSCAIVSP